MWRIAGKFVLAALLAVSTVGTLAAQTVVVLSTDSLTSTQRTISGARSTITRVHDSVRFESVLVYPGRPTLTQQLDSIRSLNPDIILTVGSAATSVAQEAFPETPIVFSSVLYPRISGFVASVSSPGGNITGASLDIPPDIQFRYFRQIIPDLKRLGVMYSANTAPLIPTAKAVAAGMGVELVAVEVTGPRDLPSVMESFGGQVDGLWSLADPVLFSPQSTKYILLNALRQGLPLMGFSRNVVESGALFALDFDYKAIGKQAGRTVNQILDGQSPGSIPVTVPDFIWFHCNEKTAQHLQIAIPPDLVAIAKEVYR